MRKWRAPLRLIVWVLLAICFLIDGALAELAVAGHVATCIIHFDENGHIIPDPPIGTLDYAAICGFVLFQAGLCLAAIRLRKPKMLPKLLAQ